MSEKMSNSRARVFASVVYPDSAPENWRDILVEQFIPCFISPLHDLDIDPLDQPKKPHYHVMLLYDAPHTNEQAKEIFDKISAVGLERVNSTRGYARYLCHLDNPEKHQYSADDVTCLCGADYFYTIGLPTDKYTGISEMEAFCDKYNVDSYYLLTMYAAAHRSDWHRLLCDCASVHMSRFLKSRKWSREVGALHIVDEETGDIIF